MDLSKYKFNSESLLIIYKLLHDLLFLLLLFFGMALVAEGVLPGIITAHVGFSKIVFLVVFNLLAIFFTGQKIKIEISAKDDKKTTVNKKLTAALVILFGLLVFNSLWAINIWLNLFLVICSLATLYLLVKLFFEE